jgi:hypothetical protein
MRGSDLTRPPGSLIQWQFLQSGSGVEEVWLPYEPAAQNIIEKKWKIYSGPTGNAYVNPMEVRSGTRLYWIDFENLRQTARTDHTKRRKIRRVTIKPYAAGAAKRKAADAQAQAPPRGKPRTLASNTIDLTAMTQTASWAADLTGSTDSDSDDDGVGQPTNRRFVNCPQCNEKVQLARGRASVFACVRGATVFRLRLPIEIGV